MRGVSSLRRFQERRSLNSINEQSTELDSEFRKVEASRRLWKLRFYLWRQTLLLSVATVLAGDTVVATVTGGTPEAVTLVKEILAAVAAGA